MRQMLKGVVAVLAAGAMAACGGGGGAAGTPVMGGSATGGTGSGSGTGSGTGTVTTDTGGTATGTTGTGGTAVATPARIEVISSAPEVGNAGEQVTVTAVVKDAGNATLANRAVTVSAGSGTVTPGTATTDAAGVVSVKFSAGADPAERLATVTVAAGGVSGSVDVAVVGTRLAYSGPTQLSFGAAGVPLAVKVTNSAGAVIANAPVTVSSALGNTLSAATVRTSTQGVASVLYTAARAGTDTVTFNAAGKALPVDITVAPQNNESLTIAVPAGSEAAAVGASIPVSVSYLVGGAPASGPYAVRFAATAGSFAQAQAASGIALSNGSASATLSSTFAGPVTVQGTLVNTATGATVARTATAVRFVGVTPAAVNLQVSPASLAPNATGSATNQVQLLARVTDRFGNVVPNAVVNFSKLADPSGGDLSQASAVTNADGQASVQYVAGALSTPADGVRLQAVVAGDTSVTPGTAALTVNQRALYLALGTGNTITNAPDTDTRYRKTWTLYVTDASGVAVPNQLVTVSVLPTRYRKGSYVLPEGAEFYTQREWQAIDGTAGSDQAMPQGTYFTCANEDTDYSGHIGSLPGKDANGSGRLEPGNVVTVNGGPRITTVTTDTAGFATIHLEYAESYAHWVEVRLRASTLVAGTEWSNQSTFWVSGMRDDYSASGGPPAGLYSPFGQRPSCSDPN